MFFDEFQAVLVSPPGKPRAARGRQLPGEKPVSGRPVSIHARLVTLASMLLVVFCTSGSRAAERPACLLKPAGSDNDLVRVNVVLEVEGHLQLQQAGQKQVRRVPVKAKGTLLYDERRRDQDRSGTLRHYHEAAAEIGAHREKNEPTLREERRTIVNWMGQDGAVLFSPLGPFTREELELIEVPANSGLVNDLLPGKEVRIGERWEHDAPRLAELLNLNAVNHAVVHSTLREVDKDVARIELAGTVSGNVDGVTTSIELKGKYNFDVTARRIVWLALAIKERRAISETVPGFDVVARLRMLITPLDDSPPLGPEALAGMSVEPQAGSKLLEFRSKQRGFQFLHDRRWHVMMDRSDVTVLRLVEDGSRVAQCNISRLPDAAAGKHIRLEQFQEDVQRALGNNLGQFLSATQTSNEAGLREFRVAASGTVSDVPVQWIYYHLSDGLGHRAALVFTLETKSAERFTVAAADRVLIDSFQLTDEAPIAQRGSEPPPNQSLRRPNLHVGSSGLSGRLRR